MITAPSPEADYQSSPVFCNVCNPVWVLAVLTPGLLLMSSPDGSE